MKDEEKLEVMTSAIVHVLIHNKLKNLELYDELAKRARELCAAEKAWRYSKEEERILMSGWGDSLN